MGERYHKLINVDRSSESDTVPKVAVIHELEPRSCAKSELYGILQSVHHSKSKILLYYVFWQA
jgi:hypothetical protein